MILTKHNKLKIALNTRGIFLGIPARKKYDGFSGRKKQTSLRLACYELFLSQLLYSLESCFPQSSAPIRFYNYPKGEQIIF